jgi:hypothetical protein
MEKDITALAAGVLATPLSFVIARWAIDSGAAHASQAEPNWSAPVNSSADLLRQKEHQSL